MAMKDRTGIARRAWRGWRKTMISYLEEVEQVDEYGKRFEVADQISFCRLQMRDAAKLRLEAIKLLFCATIILCVGCSNITVAPKPVVAHSIAFDQNTQNAGIIDCTKDGCLVTNGWILHYRKLEKANKNYIGADKDIKQEGVNWRISYECLNHFLTLRQAERGA